MPSSEDLPDPAIECSSILAPALQADSLPLSHGLLLLSRFSHVRLFVTPWTVAHQTPLSMGILQARTPS